MSDRVPGERGASVPRGQSREQARFWARRYRIWTERMAALPQHRVEEREGCLRARVFALRQKVGPTVLKSISASLPWRNRCLPEIFAIAEWDQRAAWNQRPSVPPPCPRSLGGESAIDQVPA